MKKSVWLIWVLVLLLIGTGVTIFLAPNWWSKERVFHVRDVWDLSLSPDGRFLAVGDASRVRLWDVATGNEKPSPDMRSSTPEEVLFSPDSTTLAWRGAGDAFVNVWDVANGKALATLEHRGVTRIAFSPDGKTIASGGGDRSQGWIETGRGDRRIILWDLPSGKKKRVLEGHRDTVVGLAFSPDGETLASASEGEGKEPVRLWKADTGEKIARLGEGTDVRYEHVTGLAFSPDGTRLAIGRTGALQLWDMDTHKAIASFKGHFFRRLSFSPDGKMIICAEDGYVKFLDVATGKEKATFFHGENPIIGTRVSHLVAVSLSADGSLLAYGGRTSVRLRNVADLLGPAK